MVQQYQSLVQFEEIIKEKTEEKQNCESKMADMNKFESERLQSIKFQEEKYLQMINQLEGELS